MIDKITQNISPVTPLPGLLVENRPAAVNQLVEEELPLLSTQLKTLVGQLNTTISQTNIAVDIAANAAVVSNSLSNYVGEWSTLVPYDKNQATSIGTLYYISKVDNNLNHIVTDTNYWLPNPVNTKIDYNMSGYTEKVTPVDTDLFPLSDSAATFGIKKLTWANIKATLNTLYLALTGAQTVDGVKTFTSSPIVPAPTTNTQAANKAYVDSIISNIQALPIGAILNGYTIFPNCIVAFGGEFNRADYPKLWAYLQANPTLVKTQAQWTTESTTNGGICGFFSDGNGTTTFRVPNLDKAFLRPDNRGVGSYQGDTIRNITGSAVVRAAETDGGASGALSLSDTTQSAYGGSTAAKRVNLSFNASYVVPTSTENRPKNIAVLPLIVAK